MQRGCRVTFVGLRLVGGAFAPTLHACTSHAPPPVAAPSCSRRSMRTRGMPTPPATTATAQEPNYPHDHSHQSSVDTVHNETPCPPERTTASPPPKGISALDVAAARLRELQALRSLKASNREKGVSSNSTSSSSSGSARNRDIPTPAEASAVNRSPLFAASSCLSPLHATPSEASGAGAGGAGGGHRGGGSLRERVLGRARLEHDAAARHRRQHPSDIPAVDVAVQEMSFVDDSSGGGGGQAAMARFTATLGRVHDAVEDEVRRLATALLARAGPGAAEAADSSKRGTGSKGAKRKVRGDGDAAGDEESAAHLSSIVEGRMSQLLLALQSEGALGATHAVSWLRSAALRSALQRQAQQWAHLEHVLLPRAAAACDRALYSALHPSPTAEAEDPARDVRSLSGGRFVVRPCGEDGAMSGGAGMEAKEAAETTSQSQTPSPPVAMPPLEDISAWLVAAAAVAAQRPSATGPSPSPIDVAPFMRVLKHHLQCRRQGLHTAAEASDSPGVFALLIPPALLAELLSACATLRVMEEALLQELLAYDVRLQRRRFSARHLVQLVHCLGVFGYHTGAHEAVFLRTALALRKPLAALTPFRLTRERGTGRVRDDAATALARGQAVAASLEPSALRELWAALAVSPVRDPRVVHRLADALVTRWEGQHHARRRVAPRYTIQATTDALLCVLAANHLDASAAAAASEGLQRLRGISSITQSSSLDILVDSPQSSPQSIGLFGAGVAPEDLRRVDAVLATMAVPYPRLGQAFTQAILASEKGAIIDCGGDDKARHEDGLMVDPRGTTLDYTRLEQVALGRGVRLADIVQEVKLEVAKGGGR